MCTDPIIKSKNSVSYGTLLISKVIVSIPSGGGHVQSLQRSMFGTEQSSIGP